MEERKKIAKWLYDKIMAEDYAEQETVVYEIKELFGDKYTYLNKNDNLAIDLGVLKEFGKLKKDDIEWDRSVKAWSKKEKDDSLLDNFTERLPQTDLPEIKIDFQPIDIEFEEIDIDDLSSQ